MKILFFISLLIFAQSLGVYKFVKHSKERGAMCLDGSPAALYINEGHGVNKDKFYVHFSGGGHCGDDNLEKTI